MDKNVVFIETLQVKAGVKCDVYAFKDDATKDLGVVTVQAGCKTPLQKVLKGDRTSEIFQTGKGKLHITRADGTSEVHEYPGGQPEVEVCIGDTMQWEAKDELVFHEICYPPYEDGRYENIHEQVMLIDTLL